MRAGDLESFADGGIPPNQEISERTRDAEEIVLTRGRAIAGIRAAECTI